MASNVSNYNIYIVLFIYLLFLFLSLDEIFKSKVLQKTQKLYVLLYFIFFSHHTIIDKSCPTNKNILLYRFVNKTHANCFQNICTHESCSAMKGLPCIHQIKENLNNLTYREPFTLFIKNLFVVSLSHCYSMFSFSSLIYYNHQLGINNNL